MFASQHIPYAQTASFSKLVLHYLDNAAPLQPFYSHRPDVEGIGRLLTERQSFATNRSLLVQVLTSQYTAVTPSPAVLANIEALLSSDTFTVCTAHQPNLFTGPLYFMYKVLHTIKLAAFLQETFPGKRFVPVYYMGSEDADFAELNHTFVDGKKLEWNKAQKGAVGRMVVDKTLQQLIDELEAQLVYEPYGHEVAALFRKCYTAGRTIQEATFELVNELYGQWGLVVLIPDNPLLKAQMAGVFAEDLFQHSSLAVVEKTSADLAANYNAQAYPRAINLFYLLDNLRERIEKRNDEYVVLNTDIRFSAEELKNELAQHPERFSPNVILRGLYQETILPNLAFVGGGGEMAYWLQLRDLFRHHGVPYPVLVLRNSFLVIDEKWKAKLQKTGLPATALFQSDDEIIRGMISRQSAGAVSLNGKLQQAEELYAQISQQATTLDQTLNKHVAAIRARSLKELAELEKKMLRAEKRKYADQQRQVAVVKGALFPNGGLQERVENFSWFYAKWGRHFLAELLHHSLALEQQFTILTIEA